MGPKLTIMRDAIAMRDRQPFAFAGLWENWKDRSTAEWVRTFTILTTARLVVFQKSSVWRQMRPNANSGAGREVIFLGDLRGG